MMLLYNYVAFGHSRPMASLTEYTSFADAQAHFSAAGLWELFDGDRERLNIAHECIDRHAGRAPTRPSSSPMPTGATRS